MQIIRAVINALRPDGAGSVIRGIVGRLSSGDRLSNGQPWPPEGSLRGDPGRPSKGGGLGPNQIAWIDANMPLVSVIAGQASAAKAHSESSRQDRKGELIS